MDEMKSIAVIEQRGSSLPAPVVSNTQWAERRKAFNEWVNTQLRKGVDFGEIPGTDKPSLLKPGAEKILQLYGCSVETETTHRDQDTTTGYLYIEVAARAVSIQSGIVVGVGLGSCSAYESKYRWRWEWWNGKGAPQGDDWEQTRGGKWRRRIENRDLFDQWNTVLKMAKKRALVDLALTISGASEKFTQDVEDMNGEDHRPEGAETQKAADWTQIKAERDAFQAWREKLTLSDSECKRLAAAYQGKPEPLALFQNFGGTRLELQNAIEAQMAREQAMQREPEPSQLTM